MFALFIRCIACSSPIDLKTDGKSFPLCQVCKGSLVPSPPLCNHCGSPVCLQTGPAPILNTAVQSAESVATGPTPECRRPWIDPSGIHSSSARYLLIGNGYPVLRKWKTRGGILFDRQVLSPDASLVSRWKQFNPNAVVPLPQFFLRAWKMKGSPAEKIARWVSQLLNIPLVKALHTPRSSRLSSHRPRQAELSIADRMKNKIQFSTDRDQVLGLKRVILVDDFRTSGRTLRLAAAELRAAGVDHIHAFSLGIRLFYSSDSKNRSHLEKRAGRTITIGQEKNAIEFGNS